MIQKIFVGILILVSLSANAEGGDWAERIYFSNDFRFRNEYIDQTKDSSKPVVRQRLRARLGLGYQVNEQVFTELKLASGSDDPTSLNETFDGGFTTKGFQLDEAYAKWTAVKGLNIYLGKAKMIFYTIGKNEIVWDGDIKPEGVSAEYATKWGDLYFEVNASNYWVDQSNSDTEANREIMLSGLQIRGAGIFTGDLGYEIGAAIYDYSNLKGHTILTKINGTKSMKNGNSGTTVYTENYQIIDAYVGFSAKVMNQPLLVYYNLVNNARSSSKQNGFIAGVNFGKVKEVGDISFRYSFRKVEDDAVFGAFTDSNFNNGNTNGVGSEIGADYGLAEKTVLAATFFANKNATSGGDDYYRGQLDVSFSF